MTTQLRIYRVRDGALDEFISGWTKLVRPLRERFGFRIDGAWRGDDEVTFVWLVSYDGPDGFEAADARYYASDERAALDPDPARLLVETRHVFVEPLVERGGEGT